MYVKHFDYRRMLLYISLPKTRSNISIPIPASAEFLTGDVITVPLGSISDPSRNWNNFNDYHLFLLACSRILEYFDTSSPSLLKTGLEMMLSLDTSPRFSAVEVAASVQILSTE